MGKKFNFLVVRFKINIYIFVEWMDVYWYYKFEILVI